MRLQREKLYVHRVHRDLELKVRFQGVIVFVKSERDISTTLLLSKKYGTEIAVSGGKHSSSGASSTTGGLVIDLAEMHGVVVDAEKKTLSVQGGAVWKDVDDAAAVHGLATVGGTVNHTGVGGLTLGGGYGWLSGRYGLTIDNLLEVKMILANGTLVTASENINPDLFWAVRGAGQCFGVVVEFTFQAFPQAAPIWAGQMLFSAEKHLDAIVEFANKFVERNDCDAAMAVGITAPPMLKEIAINTSVFYNGTEEAGKALFEPLMRLNPIMNNVHVRPYSEVNGMLNHLVPYGRSKLSKGASFVAPLRPEFIRSLVTALETIHREVPDSKRTLLNLEFHSPDLWCKVPRTATSFANRGRHQNILIMPMWSDQKYNDRVRLWAREVAAMFAAELDRIRKELGNPKDMVNITEYANYDCKAPRRYIDRLLCKRVRLTLREYRSYGIVKRRVWRQL